MRIGHQHATALRDALCGDILEYRAHDASWHIRQGIDRSQDPLPEAKEKDGEDGKLEKYFSEAPGEGD